MKLDENKILPLPGLVVMMCGIAGSGKTTFSKKLEKLGFIRLSIDEEIWDRFGKYGIDYEEKDYDNYQKIANKIIKDKLEKLLIDKKAVVLDLSFWSRSEREKYKKIISNFGGSSKIIYLKISSSLLKKRLELRNKRYGANSAFPITEEIIDKYLLDFEEPKNEDEIIIKSI